MAFIKYASIKNWNEVNETVENVTRWEYSKRNHDNKQLFHLHSFKQGSHASLKVLEFECLVIESPWFYPVTARVNTHVLYKRHFLKTLKKKIELESRSAIHKRSQMWSHVWSVVQPTFSPWKLFTKYVARTNVANLVVNLRHTCSCRTPIVNLKIWQIINNYVTYTHHIVIYLHK